MVDKKIHNIINDWAYKCQNGYPSLTNEDDLNILRSILITEGFPIEFANTYIENINLFGLLLETPETEKILKKKIINPETGKQISVATALEYGPEHPAYKLAQNFLGDKKDKKEEPTTKPKTQDKGVVKVKKDTSSPENDKLLKSKDAGPKKVVNGRDKTLKQTDTLKSRVFTEPNRPTDVEFDKSNKTFRNDIPPPPFRLPKEIQSNVKVPKKYLNILERIINTSSFNGTPKWEHFSNFPTGAGTLPSQAGELLSMLCVTMDDNNFKTLTKSISEYQNKLEKINPKKYKKGNMVLSPGWVDAAIKNRKSILNRIKKQYGNNAKIVSAAWDTREDVTALGLPDYNKNKGVTTDIYLKVQLENGEQVLDEVSLKQSLNTNLLNSSAGKITKWNPKLRYTSLNIKNYAKKVRGNIESTFKKQLPKIKQLMQKSPSTTTEIRDLLRQNNINNIEELLNKKQTNKNIDKIMFHSIKTLADNGDAESKKFIQNQYAIEDEYSRDAVAAINKDTKLKEEMLKEIRNEFPIKSVMTGEESMALGEYSLDKKTIKEIFGTDDYEAFKELLTTVKDSKTNKYYLAYKTQLGDKTIPISYIDIRSSAKGYSTDIRFHMKLHDEFKKHIEKAHKSIYGK